MPNYRQFLRDRELNSRYDVEYYSPFREFVSRYSRQSSRNFARRVRNLYRAQQAYGRVVGYGDPNRHVRQRRY